MNPLVWLLLFLTISVALAWHRAGLRLATAAYAALLLAYGVFGHSLGLFGLGLLVFAGIFVPLSLPTLRQEWLTRPLLDRFRRDPQALAPLAAAQDAAADQASRQLFIEGAPLLPPASAPIRDLAALLSTLRRIAALPRERQRAALVQARGLALNLPADQGGLDLNAGERSQLLAQLATSPAGAELARLIAHSASAAQLIVRHGDAAQRSQWLPLIASGDLRLVLATQTRWSARPAIPDRAVISRGSWKGRPTLGLLIAFEKQTVVAAAHASDFLVSLRVRDPEQLLAGAIGDGLTLVRVPAAMLGLKDTADGEAPSETITGHGVFLPLDHIIGGSDGIGRGEAQQRSATVESMQLQLAIASGVAARQLRARCLQMRVAGFYRLAASSAQRRDLTDAALDAYALDTLRHLLARLDASDHASAPIAALAGRVAWPRNAAALSTTQLIGSLLPRWPAAQAAAIAQPYGVALMQFDAEFWPLLGEILAHQAHAGLLGISDGRLAANENGRHGQRLQRYRAALACCADAQLRNPDASAADDHDPAESALLDAFAHTLALVAALQSHADDGHPRDGQVLLDAYCERCGRRIEAALMRFVAAQRRLRRRVSLQLLLLPLGRRTQDARKHSQLASLILSAGPLRQRLLRLLSTGDVPPESGEHLEAALDAAQGAQRRLLAHVDSGELATGFPLEQIAEAERRHLVDTTQADLLRTALQLSQAWRAQTDAAFTD